MTQPVPRKSKRELLLNAFKDDLRETVGDATELANDAITSAKQKVDAFLGDTDTPKSTSAAKKENGEISHEEKARRGKTSDKNKSMLEQLKKRGKETPGMTTLSTALNRILKRKEASGTREDVKKTSQQQDKTQKASQQEQTKKAATTQKPATKASDAPGDGKKANQQQEQAKKASPQDQDKVVVPVRAVPGADTPEDSRSGSHFRDTAVGKIFIEAAGYRQTGNVWGQGKKDNTEIRFLDATTPVYVIGLKEDLLLWLDDNKDNYVATKYDGFMPRPGRRYTVDEMRRAQAKAAREMTIYVGAGKLRAREISGQGKVCMPNPMIDRYCAELASRAARAAALGDAGNEPDTTAGDGESQSDEEKQKAAENRAKKAEEAASLQKELDELEQAGQALVKESGPLYQMAFNTRPVGQAYELFHPDTAAKQHSTLIAAIQVSQLMDQALGLLD